MVSGGQQRNSAIHTHASVFCQTPLPSRLPRNTEQSGLGGRVAVVGHPPGGVLSLGACPWPWPSRVSQGQLQAAVVCSVPCAVPCSPLCTWGLGMALFTEMLVSFKWRKGILIFGTPCQTLPSRLLEMKNWTFFFLLLSPEMLVFFLPL